MIRFVKLLLKLQNNVRLFHWNTVAYKNHIASDKLYEDIDTYVDRFVEVYMAKHGRLAPATKIQLNLDILSDQQIVPYLKAVAAYLSNDTFFDMFSNDPDLQTILSDIIEAINKAIYIMRMTV
jgi:DNA-binding ferritin-like protein